MEYKDYYKVLGLNKNAAPEEIKKSFRKLAREYHPDTNQDKPNAEERFKEINEAYQVLSDPEKRSKYDTLGQSWQQYARGGGPPEDFDWGRWRSQGGGSAHSVNFEDLRDIFGNSGGGGMGGFSDFFEALFGGGMGNMQGRRMARGQNIEQAVEITLDEAFHGTTRVFQREDGSRFETKIPRGVRSSAKIRFSGKGAPGAAGQPGDLIVKVKILPHPVFTRERDDLLVNVAVDLYTAILGGEAEVPTMERTVKLKIPAGTTNGQTIRLRGLGMPVLNHPNQRGDTLAKIEVQIPQNLSEEEKQLFHQLRALAMKNHHAR